MRYLLLVAVVPLLSGCMMGWYNSGPPPLTKGEIIALSEAGRPDSEVIGMLQRDGIDRAPTTDDIVEMNDAGVSDAVIESAVSTPVRRPPKRRPRMVYYGPSPGEILFWGLLGWHIHHIHRRH
ncbi:MAG: hypothetical protein ACYTAF_12125 [Planctomycetota bacterium]|jgi:hypothetical protein